MGSIVKYRLIAAAQAKALLVDADIDLESRPSAYAISIGVLALVLMLFLFGVLTIGKYAKVVTSGAIAVPEDALTTLSSDKGGYISEVYIKVGDFVRKDAPLILITDITRTGSGADATEKIRARLIAQKTLLEGEIDALKDEQTKKLAAIGQNITESRRQINAYQAQLVRKKGELATQEKLLNDIKSIRDKGYVSSITIQSQASVVAATKDSIDSINHSISVASANLTSLESELHTLPIEYDLKISETNRQVGQVEQDMANNEKGGGRLISAPRDGYVAAVSAYVNKTIASNDPLVSLTTEKSNIVLRGSLASGDLNAIEQGAEVNIQYDAYPYEVYGQFKGRLCGIADAPVSLPSFTTDTAARQTDTQFPYTICPEQQHLTVDGQPRSILGLHANIAFKSRSQRLYQWLFKSLLQGKERLQSQLD